MAKHICALAVAKLYVLLTGTAPKQRPGRVLQTGLYRPQL